MLRISCPDVKTFSDFKVDDLYANGNWDASGPVADKVNDYYGTKIVENAKKNGFIVTFFRNITTSNVTEDF